MTARDYFVSGSAYARIRQWCHDSPKREVGGVLGGIGRFITMAVAVPNLSSDPASFFECTIADLRRARTRIRESGLRVIGHWHSHPNGWGRPSTWDVECQSGVELIWSIKQRSARLWNLRGTRREVLDNELALFVTEPARSARGRVCR